MDFKDFERRLSLSAEIIRSMVQDVPEGQAHWKPSPQKWSIVEVINHLYDEEREDFPTRLDLMLHHPAKKWPAIDPEGWVTERGYNKRALAESLDRFLAERKRTTIWLAGVDAPDWNASFEHPQLGRIDAGSMLAAWLAHDYLHVRQLAKLHYDYVTLMSRPYSVEYAGGG